MTGEAKPGALRRSSTLLCLRVLAGLIDPSNSSVLLFDLDLTAAVMGVPGFPFDMEGPNFATGALKVNPAEGEKEGGLAAVALTIGDENVKGTEGGEETAAGSLFVMISFEGVALAAELTEVDVVTDGSGEEKLKVGNVERLMEMDGRSGTSATSSLSGCLDEGRVVVLFLLILPPPEFTLLDAGVLDRG